MKTKIVGIRAILEAKGVSFEEKPNDEIAISCPYTDKHDEGTDRHPSCVLNETKQVFNCFTCKSKGSILKVLARLLVGSDEKGAVQQLRKILKDYTEFGTGKRLDPDRVEGWHQALLDDAIMLQALYDEKGINPETVALRRIGKQGVRYTIPFRDQNGNYVLAKSYDMLRLDPGKKKFTRIEGRRFVTPIESLDKDDVILVEGEAKAYLLCQRGFNAIAPSTGADLPSEFTAFFAGKHVTILYDNDTPGANGSRKVARQLWAEAASVKIATLPPFEDPLHNDVTDYLVACDHTDEELQKVLDDAKPYEKFSLDRNRYDRSSACEDISLNQVFLDEFNDVHASFEGFVAHESEETFKTVARYDVACDKDQGDSCGRCPMRIADTPTVEILPSDPIHLEMIGASKKMIWPLLEKHAGIPHGCYEHEIVNDKRLSFKMLLVQQDAKWSMDTPRTVKVFLQDSLAQALMNVHIRLKGWTVSCPKTSEAVFFAYEHENPRQALENFTLSTDEVKELSAEFNPDEDSADSIHELLSQIYLDYENNVTRITGRRDMHFGMDLVYHSVVSFSLKGQKIYGPVDGIFLGDTATGKSEASSRLQEFYDEGTIVQVGTASRAGLLGGVDQATALGKSLRIISWGAIPINDRGLVILEEAGLIDEGTMRALRDVRTSGVCRIQKIKSSSHSARTRLMWFGNPHTVASMRMFKEGVTALRDICPESADQRRFDFMVACASEDVKSDDILRFEMGEPAREPETDQVLSQKLIRWAWSRSQGQILFTEGADNLCVKMAHELGNTYSSEIPLVLGTMKDKVARMAVALACRTFSTEDGECVLVRPSHVEYVVRWLHEIYSKTSCNYAGFSADRKAARVTRDPVAVSSLIDGSHPEFGYILSSANFVYQLLNTGGKFSDKAFQEMAGIDDEQASKIIRELLRHEAIRHLPRSGGNYYVLLPGFIALLKQTDWKDREAETAFPDEEF